VVAAADAWTKPQLLKLLKKVCTDAHTHGCVYVGV
jgi:phosphoenolpyruvate-protein kinase (PTS system EI component)